MISRCLLLVALFLSACNTPSPAFRGVQPTRIVVEGSTFEVRVKGNKAEAIRTNIEYAPRFSSIQGKAALAMQKVSGCEVVSINGDQALALGKLKCSG